MPPPDLYAARTTRADNADLVAVPKSAQEVLWVVAKLVAPPKTTTWDPMGGRFRGATNFATTQSTILTAPALFIPIIGIYLTP